MKESENIKLLGFHCSIKGNVDISIIILTYNHALYLRKCLNSVLSQNISISYEVIIHDDSSLDDTQAIIMEYYEKHPLVIKAILQQENQYSKDANIFKNIVPYISGKFIAVCEGDDYWISNDKLQRQFTFLKNHEEFIAVYHRAMVVDKDGESLRKVIPIRPNKKEFSIGDYKSYKLPGQTGSLFFRNVWSFLPKEIIDAFWDCKGIFDRKISLLLILLGKVYCLPEIMSAYRYVIGCGSSWSAINRGRNNYQFNYESLVEMNEFSEKYFHVRIKTFKREINLIADSLIFFLKSKNYRDWEIFKTIFYNSSIKFKRLVIVSIILLIPLKLSIEFLKSSIKNLYQRIFFQ